METLRRQAAEYFSGTLVVCGSNEECIAGADVISTCTNGDDQLIRAEWFRPGAFAVGIEGGCAFTAEALHSADKFVVDDIPLAEYFDRIGRDRVTEDGRPDPEFPGGMPTVSATIGQIVSGKKPGRTSSDERIVAIPIGMAISDVALAHLVYHAAKSSGIGATFKLS
jgi:ornithine cyclodeaminase/alanine dehydrogenase-like protein (mu-crystallin family)